MAISSLASALADGEFNQSENCQSSPDNCAWPTRPAA
jgi:hypothetical protein